METSILILGACQAVALLIYWWVGKVFVSQPDISTNWIKAYKKYVSPRQSMGAP